MVALPLVRYLLEQTDCELIVADRFLEKNKRLIRDEARGTARERDISRKNRV